MKNTKSYATVEEFQGKVGYLQGLTEKIIDSTRTIDNHANVMVGLNTAIFALVISMMLQVDHLRFVMSIVALFSFISAIAAIFAIRLPRIIARNNNYQKSLFHAPRIAQFKSVDEFSNALLATMASDDDLLKEYAREAYNLSKYYYMPKRKMLTLSRYFFLFGAITSSLFLLVEKIH